MRTLLSVVRSEPRPNESSTKNTEFASLTHQSGGDVPSGRPFGHALSPSTRSKCRLEIERPRRGAVDGEVLRYLGSLARKDREGFVYPSVTHIAKKIGRSAYYLGLRIKHLEGIRRLIPARRVRRHREIEGWLVIRYKEWEGSRSRRADVMRSAEPNNLDESPNNIAKSPNNLGPKTHKTETISMTGQGDKRVGAKRVLF